MHDKEKERHPRHPECKPATNEEDKTMFGRLKKLKAKYAAGRRELRERKLSEKRDRLAKEIKNARQRQKDANKEAKLRRMEEQIRSTKQKYPTRGRRAFSKLGRAAKATGKHLMSRSAQVKRAKNLDWLGDSPLMKTSAQTPIEKQAKPRKKKVVYYE